MNSAVSDIAQRALRGELAGRGELLRLARCAATDPHDVLYWAHRVRQDRFGDTVRACSIVPGRLGGCSEDCKWCAQTGRRMPLKRTAAEAIVQAADQAGQDGASSLGIVNSGRGPTASEFRGLLETYQGLSASKSELRLCASLGELTESQARQLRQAGVTRYHHNIETSRAFFPKVVTTHTYDDRLNTLAAARKAGMSVCSGGIFGLGETWDDRIDMALTLRDQVRPDVVPLNFLHPIPGTALEKTPPLAPMEILSIIAVFRIAMPDVDLKIAGGREVNLRDLQSWIFYAGGTSIIIGCYLTTLGHGAANDIQMIKDLGLRLVKDLGRGSGRPVDGRP